MNKTCPYCKQPHEEDTVACGYCYAAHRSYAGSQVQSVGEGEQWQDHVDEYKRERDEWRE